MDFGEHEIAEAFAGEVAPDCGSSAYVPPCGFALRPVASFFSTSDTV